MVVHSRWRSLLALSLLFVVSCGDAGSTGTTDSGEPAELRSLVDTLLPALESLSGLTATGPVRVERRSVAQVRAYVEAQLTDEMPPEELEGVHATYALLGLIPDTLDLRALLLD